MKQLETRKTHGARQPSPEGLEPGTASGGTRRTEESYDRSEAKQPMQSTTNDIEFSNDSRNYFTNSLKATGVTVDIDTVSFVKYPVNHRVTSVVIAAMAIGINKSCQIIRQCSDASSTRKDLPLGVGLTNDVPSSVRLNVIRSRPSKYCATRSESRMASFLISGC